MVTETLVKIVSAVNATSQRAGVDPAKFVQLPSRHRLIPSQEFSQA